MIRKILAMEEKENGWDVFAQFDEFKGFLDEKDPLTGKRIKDYIQDYIFFPQIPINPEHTFLENSLRSFGNHTIHGFIKFMPGAIDPENSMVLRNDQNSNYRKWFTGNQAEKINHHIKEEGQEFFMVTGTYPNPKDPVLDVAIKRLMAEADTTGLSDEQRVELKRLKEAMKKARGEKIPLERSFDKNYIFRKGRWVPEIVLKFQLESKKEEKDAVANDFNKCFHDDLRKATNSEDLNAVFKKYTVAIEEGDDLDLKKYKHTKWLERYGKKEPRVIEIPVAAGSSTMNYSPTSYKIKHYQVPSKAGGKRKWSDMVTRMFERGNLSDFQEEMARKMNLLQVA